MGIYKIKDPVNLHYKMPNTFSQCSITQLFKKNGIMFAVKGIELEKIISKEVTHTQKYKCDMYWFIYGYYLLNIW